MGRILERYLEAYPDAKICMIVENTQELLMRLDEGTIDFALVEGFFSEKRVRSPEVIRMKIMLRSVRRIIFFLDSGGIRPAGCREQ